MSVIVEDAVKSLDPSVQDLMGRSLNVYLCADDTLVTGESERHVQQLLYAIAAAGKQYGLELHCNKFQLLQVGAEYRFLALDGNIIPP